MGDSRNGCAVDLPIAIALVLRTAVAMACCAFSAAWHPAAAFSDVPDPAVGDLREYVRLLDTEAPTRLPRAIPTDGALAALRDYARRNDDAPAASGSAATRRGNALQVAANQPRKTPKKKAADQDATYVGAAICANCHAAQAATFNQTLMGKIFRNPRNVQEKTGCEGCHGPGSLHVRAGGGRGVGGLYSFRLDDKTHTVEEYNDVCLGCHEKGARTLWRGSEHEVRGLACTNCHTVMRNVTPKNQLAMQTEGDVCFQCHTRQRSEIWQSSHMPVREGKITCSTCHNPHGSYGDALLKTATVNDTCYKCHAEKRGPFLWEHDPVRESCLNCHDPHGSMHEALLKVAPPRLCQQCHTAADHPGNPGNPFAIYSIAGGCTNCHTRIHGSNSPAGSQFVR